MKYSLIVLLALMPIASHATGGYLVSGMIDVDQDVWQPVIFLSIVETFEDLSKVSPQMVFDDTELNADGSFELAGDFLPAGERIYRLHLRKWGDPLSTIIIGGNEHNHVHFAMSPGDSIEVISQGRVLGQTQLHGGASNNCIQDATRLADLRFNDGRGVLDNYGMREEQAARALVEIARSCKAELGALYSAFLILQKFDDTEEAGDLPGIINDRKYANSLYADEVLAWSAMKFPVEDDSEGSSSTSPILWGLLIVTLAAIGLGAGVVYRNSSSGTADTVDESDPVEQLSMQERRVLQYVANGLSNKEIASELNIEVNTVKSHVSRIYKKLNISSRREVRRFVNTETIAL